MQGNDEWREMRRGKITASRISDIMASGRGGKPSATRENYLIELALERATGKVAANGFTSYAMQRGTELEPIARAEYEISTGYDVDQVDFVEHEYLANTGASPDGLIRKDGMVEIKCPQPKAHLDTLRSKTIDRQYMLQMQWQMECADRQWCDYVSYNPDFPELLRLVVIRVKYDEPMVLQIRDAVEQAEREITELVRSIVAMEAQK